MRALNLSGPGLFYIDPQGLARDIDDVHIFDDLELEVVKLYLNKLRKAGANASKAKKSPRLLVQQAKLRDRPSADFSRFILSRFGDDNIGEPQQSFICELSLPTFLDFSYRYTITSLQRIQHLDEIVKLTKNDTECKTSALKHAEDIIEDAAVRHREKFLTEVAEWEAKKRALRLLPSPSHSGNNTQHDDVTESGNAQQSDPSDDTRSDGGQAGMSRKRMAESPLEEGGELINGPLRKRPRTTSHLAAAHTVSLPSRSQQFGSPSSVTQTSQLAGTVEGGIQVATQVTIRRPFELGNQWPPQQAPGNEEDVVESYYHASSAQQIDVSVAEISASQSTDMTNQRKARDDILKVSEFIETGKPMRRIKRQLKLLDAPSEQAKSNGAIIFWMHHLQVIIQKAILLGALLKFCVSASFILERAVEGKPIADMPMIELVFRVNNVLYTSQMPISAEVGRAIKGDWVKYSLAIFDGDRYHIM